jgi:chemotaxis regulatin CheY-phosphate phosphatase CheZ
MATKSRSTVQSKPVVRKPATKPVAPATKTQAKLKSTRNGDTGEVLKQLKSLAKELKQAAKGLEGRRGKKGQPKEISTVLNDVERMTAEAATRSLAEAEAAQHEVLSVLESLGKDWSRKGIEAALKIVSGHLSNIIVAQEFQDLAGQSIRQAVKALVGAIIVVEGGGPTEERRLSQVEIDSLLKDLAA